VIRLHERGCLEEGFSALRKDVLPKKSYQRMGQIDYAGSAGVKPTNAKEENR
jgi:hypothetical protein